MLQARGLVKRYGHVTALDGCDFELLPGEILAVIGDNGAGQTCKVANQIIVALNIEAVAEALLFAARSGADPERVRKALMGGFA